MSSVSHISTSADGSFTLDEFQLFDSHLHIIDKRYPLVPNNGYVPNSFTVTDYLSRLHSYNPCGGAVVSGSFQAFDQNYLIEALRNLGPSFVGVTQLSVSVSDDEILALSESGVRGVRFNLKRGGSLDIRHLSSTAWRVHEVANWHVELYVDSSDLPELYVPLRKLPLVSIDHLGLGKANFKTLVKLAEKGVRVKATGFGRVDFPVVEALKVLYAANPGSLMFGTDLPSTRAPRQYADNDFILVVEALGSEGAKDVFSNNAIDFYRPGNG